MLSNKKQIHKTQSTLAHNPKLETDRQRLFQRQKQIYLGMVTQGFYNLQVMRAVGADLGETVLEVPNMYISMSKLTWDRSIGEWRRFLHKFDNVTLPPDYDKNSLWKSNYLPNIEVARIFVNEVVIKPSQQSGFFATSSTATSPGLSSVAQQKLPVAALTSHERELTFYPDETCLTPLEPLKSCKIDFSDFYSINP